MVNITHKTQVKHGSRTAFYYVHIYICGSNTAATTQELQVGEEGFKHKRSHYKMPVIQCS